MLCVMGIYMCMHVCAYMQRPEVNFENISLLLWTLICAIRNLLLNLGLIVFARLTGK